MRPNVIKFSPSVPEILLLPKRHGPKVTAAFNFKFKTENKTKTNRFFLWFKKKTPENPQENELNVTSQQPRASVLTNEQHKCSWLLMQRHKNRRNETRRQKKEGGLTGEHGNTLDYHCVCVSHYKCPYWQIANICATDILFGL